MRITTATAVLGLISLVTGAVSLYALTAQGTVAEEASPTTTVTTALETQTPATPPPGLAGVDVSIERVLVEKGVATVTAPDELDDIPSVVARVLIENGVALTPPPVAGGRP